MNTNLKNSIDRATKLMNTPSDYENYTAIKIKPVHGGCCCFHCWPKTWATVNGYISPFGPLEDEGDVLIKKNNEKYVLECHESGPEIILYNVVSGILVASIVGLITIFLKTLQSEKRNRSGSLKIIKYRRIKGQTEETEIMELKIPLSEDTIEKLNDNVRNAIEKTEE